MSNQAAALIPAARIERKIFLLRGEKVMLDSDLAELYDVETKALNQAVKRNLDRFPQDFMFQLSSEEAGSILRSQIVTSSSETSPKPSKNSVVFDAIRKLMAEKSKPKREIGFHTLMPKPAKVDGARAKRI